MLGTFVVMLGFGILAPVLPNYGRSFGVGYDAVGLLISAFSFARLVSDPFVGRFIDRYGERAMSTFGAVWVGISSIAAGLAPTFPLLVLFRAVGGVGSALFFAALLSFLLRSIPAERSGRVMGVYYAAFNVGFIAGGPLGGLTARWFGLASPLYVYAGACLVAAVVFWRTLHDPVRHESETRRGGIRRLPWNRPFITVLVVNGVYLWIIGAVFQTLVPLFGTSTSIGLSITGVGFALGGNLRPSNVGGEFVGEEHARAEGIPRNPILVIRRVHVSGHPQVAQVIEALNRLGSGLGATERGQEQAGQDRNDGDHNQEFNECEAALRGEIS